MGGNKMKKAILYPEEKMQIESNATRTFLFAADYGQDGTKHLISYLKKLDKRLNGKKVKKR